MNDAQIKALTAAADIMDTERDQLSKFLEALGAKLSLREDKIWQFGGAVPHRVEIAISNERDRLASIAKELRAMLYKADAADEE